MRSAAWRVAWCLAVGPLCACAAVLGLERGELAEEPVTAREGGSSAADGANAEAYTELVLAERPLAHYPFEDPAGASVVANRAPLGSPRERDGVVVGATLGEPGARGGADLAMLAERPAARVELVWPGLPSGNAPFSIEVAVRPSAIDSARRTIVSHRDEPGADFVGYRLITKGTSVEFERAIPGELVVVRTATALEVDRWTHLAVTFDGARLRLLVGGAIADEVRNGRALPGSGTKVVVGSESDGDLPFLGRIDELSIYDRELAADKISAHAARIAP